MESIINFLIKQRFSSCFRHRCFNKPSKLPYYIDVDSCERIAASSNTARTIYLSGSPKYGLINYLYWSSYENWDGGVDRYEIFRKVNDVYDSNPLATITDSSLFLRMIYPLF